MIWNDWMTFHNINHSEGFQLGLEPHNPCLKIYYLTVYSGRGGQTRPADLRFIQVSDNTLLVKNFVGSQHLYPQLPNLYENIGYYASKYAMESHPLSSRATRFPRDSSDFASQRISRV